MYLWTKTFHILFVIAFMASVFYLPRILVNLAEAGENPAVRDRLALMGRRLYRFGHVMFAIMLVLGVLLWLGFRVAPHWWPPVAATGGWMHVKLLLVAGIFGFYLHSGILLKRAAAGGALPSGKTLRLYNEIPLLLTIPAIWLVLAKPM